MSNGRIPPFVLPVVAFLIVGVVYAVARGALTLKGLLFGLIAAAIIVLASTQMNRGPYI